MKRSLLLSGIIYLWIILALSTRNSVLLALSIPLLFYLGSGLIFGPEDLQITVKRKISSERVLPGIPVEIRLEVTNRGGRLENVHLHDELPDGVAVIEGEHDLLVTLKKNETIEFSYMIRAGRGYYRFRNVRVKAWDHLGINTKVGEIPSEAGLFVQPQIQRIGRLSIRPRSTRVYAGFIPARKGGPGVEFFGVRQYQQGDPMRWINWRASARDQHAIFINQFEQERVADVGIILDTRNRSEVRINGNDSLFDCSVNAAASLVDSFLNDGNRVGLLLYGTQLAWTYTGYGKIQRERILQSLARAKPGESMIFEKLANLPKRLFPPNAQLVLISPLHGDDLPVLIHMRARGYSLLVISPDPIAFEMASLDTADEKTSQAIRLAGIERSLMLHNLRQAGIQVLDWDVETPLDAAIHFVLSRPLPQLHSLDKLR